LLSLRISLSRFVRTTLFTVIIVNVLLDCWLIHLPGDLLSRADGQTISCCTATKRESRGTWTGREKCILGAPTIVLPSRGSRIWLQETTRSVEPRVYDERVELSQVKNEQLQRAILRNGMEWNGMERNSKSVLQNISFHHIATTIPRRAEQRARCRRRRCCRSMLSSSLSLTREIPQTGLYTNVNWYVNSTVVYAKCQLYVLRMQIAYIYKRDHLLQI